MAVSDLETQTGENRDAKQSSFSRLVQVGISLSSETDLDHLLEKILAEGQDLVGCDAASLFLLDDGDDTPSLLFKLTRNNSTDVPFKEHRLSLDASSIAGYCATTAQTLHIEDAYQLPDDCPYHFNRSFDISMGYRTVNLIVLPMIDQGGKVVGVLEFINRKIDPDQPLSIAAMIPSQLCAFDEDAIALLQSMASQAAVAIENRRLLESVNTLFDGFVQASVFAIERRDPVTSGHSFRVADLCEKVATSIDTSSASVFQKTHFDSDQMRELRYAALLHDFGKVGVREHVLTKAKKLDPVACELVSYRVALAKSHLNNHALEQLYKLASSRDGLALEMRQKIEAQRDADCRQLDQYLEWILEANEPSMLEEGMFDHLRRIKSHLVQDHDGTLTGLISEQEFLSLSIRRGSLNQSERDEIEAHVQHTTDFLRLIPWTDNLSDIPAIAGSHHEKLDGSGYPLHLDAESIPLQSRIMTVCDIYDALTAADRPYKPAMPIERALSVLQSEVKAGLLDTNVVQLFIDAQCYQVLDGKEYGFTPLNACEHSACVHHVCDYDLHKYHN